MKQIFKSTLSFIFIFVLSIGTFTGCEDTPSVETLKDNLIPIPGSGVVTSAHGSTINISWDKATNNSNDGDFVYKVVRSNLKITNKEEANNADIVQDFSPYNSPIQDIDLSPGTYYYNVIVKNEEENTALYSCSHAIVTEIATTITPGSGVEARATGTIIIISWHEATKNSDPSGLKYKLVRSNSEITTGEDINNADIIKDFTSAQEFPSSNPMTTIDEGLEPGIYYYNVIVEDNEGNTALYIFDSAELKDTTHTISGKITLPDSERLSNVYFDIVITNGKDLYASPANPWGTYQHSKDYTINNIPSGKYHLFVLIYNNELRFKNTYSGELTVKDSDTTFGINLNIFFMYNVSGEISLPNSNTLSGGVYFIQLTNTMGFDYYYTLGEWDKGNSQSYNIDVPPGQYNLAVKIFNDDILVYQYLSLTPDVVVEDSGTSFNLQVSEYIPSGQDDYEPDNEPVLAKIINDDNIGQDHTIHSTTDIDWVKFHANSGTTYSISIISEDQFFRLLVYQYFGLLLYNETDLDDDIESGNNHEPIIFECTSSADYYLKILPIDTFLGGNYKIVVQSITF